MTRILLTLALLLVALPALATPPDAEAEVRAAAETWMDTWNTHDADALVALYADGAVMAWANGEEASLDDREAFLLEGRAFFEQAATMGAHLDYEVSRVLVHGDMAVVFLSGTATFGAPLPGHVQLTMTREASGAWRILAEHAMAVSEQ